MAKVNRSIARLPLDVAADARLLQLAHRFASQCGIDGGTEIGPVQDTGSGTRRAAVRTGVVELTTVDQTAVGVEKEEVRRAGGGVRLGDLLRFVIEDGES